MTLRPKTYPMLCQCVETGLQLGWNRAHKHTENPTEQQILNEMENAIMNEICEWFDFGDNDS